MTRLLTMDEAKYIRTQTVPFEASFFLTSPLGMEHKAKKIIEIIY